MSTPVTPAGPTFKLSVGSSTSTSVAVSSDQPVNAYSFINDGSNPIQIKFFANTSTGFVSFASTSTSAYDAVIQHGAINQVVNLPARLVTATGGFASSILIAGISTAGTPNLYITPVQVSN
jgi:hypothetical protein